MKKIQLIVLFFIWACAVQAQVSVTATAGTTGPITYTNLSEAFTAVNVGTHQGAITISINGNTTEPASPTPLLQSASPSNYTSILIRPSGGNFTINSAATPANNRGIIELNGADNVTIDGDDPSTSGTRNLTVQSALSSNIVACIRLSSANVSGTNGANNVTVKNCVLVGSRNSATSVVASYGINLSNYSTTTMTTGAYSSLNTLLENNEIRRCYVGIYANGGSVSYPNTGLIIRNNTIGSTASAENIGQRGIYVSNTATSTGSAIIEGNDIRAGEYSGTGYSANVYGIEIAANNFGIRVIRNNIHDLQQANASGWAAIGIYISSATGNSSGFIQNNFIRDIVAANFSSSVSQYASHGIYSSVGFTGYSIDHNTIALSTASSSGTVAFPFSSCVTLNSALISLTSFRNNILVNSIASSNAYGMYTLATSNISGATVNNNDYFIPSGSVGFYNGSNAASLSTWKTNTGKDLNGISINPPFVSSTDLHLNVLNTGIIPFNGTGATGTGVIVDYDNATRGANPDIGADEFALAACSGTPTVSSLTVNPTVQCGTGVFVLTIVPGAISEYTYQWQTSTNGGTSWNPVSGATQNVYTTGVNTVTQLYRCIVSCSSSGLSVTSSSISATVSTNPTVTVTASNNGVFCGSGTLTAAGATTYVWNASPSLSSTSGAVVSSTASALTTYTVTGTNAAGCSSQVTITVGPPTIVINSSTPLFCETGGAISLIANSSIDPDITYTWEVQTPSVTNVTTSGYTLNCTISETSEFKVTGTGSGVYSGCVSYGYLSVGVYPLAQANVQITTSPLCAGTSAVINSGLSASNYVFSSRAYVAKTIPATATTLCANGVSSVPLGGGNLDNGGWDNVPLGFSFNFFGNNYSSLAVSTNGFLIFGSVLGYGTTSGQLGQNAFNNVGGTFPNTNNPGNIIAVMAGDHYFGNGTSGSATGDIYYWTEGYAPNRRFVLYYKDVNSCCASSSPTFSARVVLYETLGLVDIFIDNNNQAGPNSVGVQNGSKTIGISPTGLDYFSNSITTSQAWRMFAPTNFLTTWNQNSGSGNTQIASGYNLFSQTVTPLVTTTYSLQYTNTLTGCSNGSSQATAVVNVIGTTAPSGVTTSATAPSVCNPETFTLSTNYSSSLDGITLNWQSSLNGNSWTNISGATASTLTTTHSTQSYYRLQFISCGGTPSYSSPLLVGHSCGIPGCTVVSACNYNPSATINDGSCVAATAWYLDADADGYYVSQTTACSSPGVGYSTTAGISGDCNDTNASIHVGVSEVCNGVDDNCNTIIDEGLSTSNTTIANACNSYTWNVNGLTYTNSGTYSVTSGCHTEILNLTITASTSNTTTASSCGSYTWSVNGQTYTSSGTYSVVSGCHTEILVLTITPISNNTTNATACDSYTWSVSGLVYTTSGTYSVVSGCHTEILSLIINTSTVYYADSDGDGYGTAVTANFCTAPSSGYSLVTGDCNDSQISINPGASENCFNSDDDNCDGNINEGCLSAIAGEEPYNALSAPSSMYSYCSSFYSTLAGAFPSTLAQSTCVTGEDRWYNFTTLSTGVTIFIGSNANDIVIELQDANGNVIDVENSVSGIGTEVLTKTGLTLGATYRVGIRNYNSNAQAGGQFSGCIRHMRAGGSDSGTSATWPSTIGMCNVFKAAYCGGTGVQYRYTWTGLTGIAAGQVYTKTQTSDYLTITSVTPMLPAGCMYNVLVTAIYTIPNGAGVNEVFEMPAVSPTTITISANPLTSLRTSDQCAAGPRYRGSVVASLPWVCGVTNWRWRFTEVNPLNLQTVGLPIEQNRGAASNYLTLTTVTALQYGKTYAVQTAPIYTYTGTNYQWGPVTYMCIIGSAGLIVDPLEGASQGASQNSPKDVAQDASQDLPQDLASHLSQNLELNVFPNPSNGEGVTMSLSGITSDNVQVKVYDALGRKIESKRYVVDGMLQTTLNFKNELSNGLYILEVTTEDVRRSVRFMVEQ